MQCQMCDKQATVHLTEIVNGTQVERHLCEACAQNEGITIKTHVPISELLTNLMTAQQETRNAKEIHCDQCGMSWSDFRKRGLLGCPNDYVAFDKRLRPLIERAQDDAGVHVGRVPRHGRSGISQQAKLVRLRQELTRAVEQENYEGAATLRDKISQMERN